MNDKSTKAEILASLEPLFKRAEAEGLWFHCNYQDLWFSPAELRKRHVEGSFIWGPVNWNLRDPEEYALEAERAALSARQHAYEVRQRISQ